MIRAGLLSLFFLAASARPAEAVCPVCTVAVGAGVGLSRYLGIDDVITGLWIGGLIVSMALWMAEWIKGKGVKLPHLRFWMVTAMTLLTVVPLVLTGVIGHPANTLWGIDKLLLGTIVGMGMFLLSVITDKVLRKTNEGKVYIAYQKVILPVGYLGIASLLLFAMVK